MDESLSYDGALRRPGGDEDGAPDGGDDAQPPPRKRVPGPRCPACHHGNPASRVRCEICGEELWPGGAAVLAPAPPALPLPPEPPARGGSGRVLALVLVPVIVITAVFVLAALLD